MIDVLDIDVRPILRDGGEPFPAIMAAVDQLQPQQSLRLYAPFKPIPLFGVMANKGFAYSETELDDGEWEILFTPVAASTGQQGASGGEQPTSAGQQDDVWSEPVMVLDNRDLDPPEPMVRILAAAEELRPGETLSALLSREPVFLFPELERRGYRWLGGFRADGADYELTILVPR